MSVTDQNGWGEVERRARKFECDCTTAYYTGAFQGEVTITTEDRLRGAVVEALSQLELGHLTAAQQILEDSLKIGDKEHGKSGKTRRQIIQEYKDHEEKRVNALKWLEGVPE